jgi:hypothetical protein
MRVIEKPYWCRGSPLAWQVDGIGLAQFALEGRVGMFNLCWMMLQRDTPPAKAITYSHTNLRWVILLSGGVFIEGRSLEHHASMLHFEHFRFLMYRWITKNHKNPVDFPGSVPWKLLYDLSTAKGKLK